jgi:uncharacterized membrane protein YccC
VRSRVNAALAAIDEARRRFSATPYRPAGATGRTAATANLVNDVVWIAPFAVEAPSRPKRSPFPTEFEEAKAASGQVLGATASLLEGERSQPDLKRLDDAHAAIGPALSAAVASTDAAKKDLAPAFDEAFWLCFVSSGVLEIGAQGMLAEGRRPPRLEGQTRPYSGAARDRSTPAAIARLLRSYADPEAVWFRNSVRGAVALGLAVLIALLIDLQHGFWVVLATLSVLRSNALNTGSTVLRALAGTVVGIVVGAGIHYAIGADTAALWAVLPVTVLIAAYAPRAISFAAGQASFTVAILTMFDLLAPAGWQVGLVRVEDIAIGCAISFGVGILFWPRGAAGVVREQIASAYTTGVDYVAGNIDFELRSATIDELDRSAREAEAALLRLDDAVRQYLSERSTAPLDVDSLGVLIAGAARLARVARIQRTGLTLFALDRPVNDSPAGLDDAYTKLDGESSQLHSWYRELAEALSAATAPPGPLEEGAGTEREVLEWVEANAALPWQALGRGLGIAWSEKLLDMLRRVQPELVEAGAGLNPEGAPPRSERLEL